MRAVVALGVWLVVAGPKVSTRAGTTGPARTTTGVVQGVAQSSTPPAQDNRPSFVEWLEGVRTEALARGIRQDVIDAAFSDVDEPLPVIIERDRSQAETVLPLEAYVSRRLTPKFVKSAREAYAGHRALLDEVSDRYGVSPRIIVAIWGIESNYGRFSGVRPTISALATLAWDPRRATFFRRELFNALEILNRGDIELARLRGSWAGAMGQVQFMPSSYLEFAEDFDGDGRRDIWTTQGDVFASIANYLKGHGWTRDAPWGVAVNVSPDAARKIRSEVERRNGSCQATRDMSVALPTSRWQELGVRLPGGKPLPEDMPDAALVSGATQHYLVYPNYDALLDYNCAHSYAVSVGVLAGRLGGAAAASTSKSPAKTKKAPARKAKKKPR